MPGFKLTDPCPYQKEGTQESSLIISFNWGFAHCKMILYNCYPKISPVIGSLLLANASIEERVRIMRARRVRFLEELDSSYMYLSK